MKSFTLSINRLPESISGDVPVYNVGLGRRVKNILLGTYKDTTPKTALDGLFEGTPKGGLYLNTSELYHHLTYQRVKDYEDINYVHIDNHADAGYVRGKKSSNVCFASFTEDIAHLSNISDIYMLGAGYPPVSSCSGADIDDEDWKAKIDELDIGKDIYLSIDLDVLNSANYNSLSSQGLIDLERLLDIIEYLKPKVVAADIVNLDKRSELEIEAYDAVSKAIQGEDFDLTRFKELRKDRYSDLEGFELERAKQ